MNGLRYIRTRCNISLSELADALGVTRQIISAWETEKKPISEARLTQLAQYFGVDKKYFLDISDIEKQELLAKGMFRYTENGKQTYRYIMQSNSESCDKTSIYFLTEGSQTLDEQFIAAKKKKQAVLDKADELIRYYDKGGSIEALTGNINRGCRLYDSLNQLFDEMPTKKTSRRAAYFQSIENTLMALMLAYELLVPEDVQKHFEHCNGDAIYDETDWVVMLAKQFKTHWEDKIQLLAKADIEFKNQLKQKTAIEKVQAETQPCNAKKFAEESVQKYKEFKEKHSGDTPSLAVFTTSK